MIMIMKLALLTTKVRKSSTRLGKACNVVLRHMNLN